MQKCFELTEFPGCCAFVALINFARTANKESIKELKRTVTNIELGDEDGYTGGIVCTLNHIQVKVWDKHLKALGFQCLSSGLLNPNTGNTINTYLLDLEAEVPDEEDNEFLR